MQSIDEMVRDFTQVHPRSKSEVRSRIQELLDAHTNKVLGEIIKKIEKDRICEHGCESHHIELIEEFKK